MDQKKGPTQAQLESDLWVLLETSVPNIQFDISLLPVVAKWAQLKIQEADDEGYDRGYDDCKDYFTDDYDNGFDDGYADGYAAAKVELSAKTD